MSTRDQVIDTLTHLAEQVEGPYKWYVIGGVALFLTAGITRFIFKTYKWFFIVVAIGALVLAIVWSLANTAGITLVPGFLRAQLF